MKDNRKSQSKMSWKPERALMGNDFIEAKKEYYRVFFKKHMKKPKQEFRYPNTMTLINAFTCLCAFKWTDHKIFILIPSYKHGDKV